jgi:predicted Zn-dependent peptidase
MTKSVLASTVLAAAIVASGCASTQKMRETEVKESATASEEWRRQRPTPAAPESLRAPTFQRATLKNGATVIVSERHDLPIVSVDVALRSGAANDPEGKAGLAQLTGQLLLEGAGSRDAAALDLAFADLGTSPSVSTGVDGSLIGVELLRENLEGAMELLRDIVLHPRFDPASFQHRKEQALSALAYQAGNPRFLGSEAMAAALYGEHHPYGRLGSGTPQSVESLTLQDAKAYWAQAANPRQAAFIYAGDITLDEAVALSEEWFGGWQGKPVQPTALPTPKVRERKAIVLVPKPGLGQTLILVGRPAIAAGDPAEDALDLANAVYGGIFGSRLNMNLREDKGYTYGARSNVDARRGVGAWIASSAVRADVTGPALAEFFSELEGMKVRPITTQELEGAREGKVHSIPGWFETVGSLASAGARLYSLDLPLDHYDRLIQGLQSTTAGEVQQAADTYLTPDLMQVVLVGDPEIVQAQVPALGLGAIEVRSALAP